MDLWTALKIWLSGDKLPEHAELIGLSIIWWARLAKCLQFTSGSVILVEIIGLKRLREGGSKIRNFISWKTIFTFPEFLSLRRRILSIDLALSALQEEPEYTFEYEPSAAGDLGGYSGRGTSIRRPNPKYSKENNLKIWEERRKLEDEKGRLQQRVKLGWFHKIPGFAGICVAIYLTYALRHVLPADCLGFVLWLPLLLSPVIYFVSIFIFMFCLATLLRLPLFFAEVIILEPIGRILSSKRFKGVVLLTSYVLLLIGFVVDILTS